MIPNRCRFTAMFFSAPQQEGSSVAGQFTVPTRGWNRPVIVATFVMGAIHSLLAGPASGSPYSDAVLSDSPVAYYRFEDASSSDGSTAANSASTGSAINGTYNGPDMTLVGNSFNGGTNGLGNAIDLANLSTINYVRVLDHSSLDLTTAATLEAWINAPSAAVASNTYARILDKARSTSYMLFLNASSGQPTVQNGGHTIGDTEDLRGGGWTHVVATFDSTVGWRMYVDGVLAASDSNTTPLATNNEALDLFKDPMSLTGDRYTGQADEIAIYNTALSADRILAHYNAASIAAAVPEPSTLALTAAAGVIACGACRRRRWLTRRSAL